MTEYEILDGIQTAYRKILGPKLTGIYVHGSLAFGCFRWEVSDIDFLVVVNTPLELAEKEALIGTLLELDAFAPPKGLEMSVVLDSVCKPFRHPTPFELHFSNTHKERCREDLAEYCRSMNGADVDLAAHFVVIRQAGQVLLGEPIEEVFAPVPKEAYWDSIRGDIGGAETDIVDDPVYYTLNLCRVLACLKDGLVLSKEQGGRWGAEHLEEYSVLILSALDAYTNGTEFQAETSLLTCFAREMLILIQKEAEKRNC